MVAGEICKLISSWLWEQGHRAAFQHTLPSTVSQFLHWSAVCGLLQGENLMINVILCLSNKVKVDGVMRNMWIHELLAIGAVPQNCIPAHSVWHGKSLVCVTKLLYHHQCLGQLCAGRCRERRNDKFNTMFGWVVMVAREMWTYELFTAKATKLHSSWLCQAFQKSGECH